MISDLLAQTDGPVIHLNLNKKAFGKLPTMPISQALPFIM
jgi:hypothetical protein